MTRQSTMLDLIDAVSSVTESEAELIATVVYLVNSGTVRLCGNFAGARFTFDDCEIPDVPTPAAVAA